MVYTKRKRKKIIISKLFNYSFTHHIIHTESYIKNLQMLRLHLTCVHKLTVTGNNNSPDGDTPNEHCHGYQYQAITK